MIQEPLPVAELKKAPEDREQREMVRLDLGCGQNKMEGFKGCDKAPAVGVDYVFDLVGEEPWPFDDESVDEARAIHVFEHFDGLERVRFMNELYRILKPGAGCVILVPAPFSHRAIQDFTHKWPPVAAESFFYFNAEWRRQNKLTHGDYAKIGCDFDFNSHGMNAPLWSQRAEEVKQFSMIHYVNALTDLQVLVIKKHKSQERSFVETRLTP